MVKNCIEAAGDMSDSSNLVTFAEAWLQKRYAIAAGIICSCQKDTELRQKFVSCVKDTLRTCLLKKKEYDLAHKLATSGDTCLQ